MVWFNGLVLVFDPPIMPNQLIDVAVIPIIPQSNKLATVDPEPRAC